MPERPFQASFNLSRHRVSDGTPLLQPSHAEPGVPVLVRNRTALLWIGGLRCWSLFAANELRRFSKRRQLTGTDPGRQTTLHMAHSHRAKARLDICAPTIPTRSCANCDGGK
jgi:hypothetical protein